MPHKTLGLILRTARESRNFSLLDVEQATGISRVYLGELEADRTKRPSPEHLLQLATLYAIDHDRLMSDAGYYIIKRNDLGLLPFESVRGKPNRPRPAGGNRVLARLAALLKADLLQSAKRFWRKRTRKKRPDFIRAHRTDSGRWVRLSSFEPN